LQTLSRGFLKKGNFMNNLMYNRFTNLIRSNKYNMKNCDFDLVSGLMKDANIFVYEVPEIDTPMTEKEFLETKKIDYLNLPFKTCWFEFVTNNSSIGIELNGEKMEGEEKSPHFFSLLRKILKDLNSKKFINENVSQKLKSKKECIFFKRRNYKNIKNHSHIFSKQKNIVPLFGGEIDWSHRWEVRGHWRKCDGIGKDREGKRCVNNFTWVKEHEKGPEDLPLIKKTRIIES